MCSKSDVSEGKNHTKLSIKGLRQVTGNFNSNSPLLCKKMALKMTLINNIIYVKIHSLIFEDAVKSKWHLTIGLYRGIFRARPSKQQRKKVFLGLFGAAPGAEKPGAKAIRTLAGFLTQMSVCFTLY